MYLLVCFPNDYYSHIYSPNCSLKASTTSFSSEVRRVSSNLAKTGCGKYHRILEVNPLALFEVSWITGRAVYGCVNPRNENDVRSILKFAFPVTARQNRKYLLP